MLRREVHITIIRGGKNEEEWQFMTDIQILTFKKNGDSGRLSTYNRIPFLPSSERNVQIREYV